MATYKYVNLLMDLDISHACKLYLILAQTLMDPRTKEFNALKVKKHFKSETGRRSQNTLIEKGLISSVGDKYPYLFRLNISDRYIY